MIMILFLLSKLSLSQFSSQLSSQTLDEFLHNSINSLVIQCLGIIL